MLMRGCAVTPRQDGMLAHLIGVHGCYGTRKTPNLAMLTAYFDESGIHKGDHLCVVAGWVGNDTQWLSFVADWIKALGHRKNLHMKSLRSWEGHRSYYARLLSKLGPIPEEHHLRPVYGGIWQRDHEEIVKGKVKETFTSAYMLAAQLCMKAALQTLPASETLAYVFAQQKVYKNAAQRLHDVVFRVGKFDSRVLGVDFIVPASTVCLDPADFLAFQLREYNSDPSSLKAKLGMPIFGKSGGKGFGVGHIHTKKELSDLVATLVRLGFLPEDTLHKGNK